MTAYQPALTDGVDPDLTIGPGRVCYAYPETPEQAAAREKREAEQKASDEKCALLRVEIFGIVTLPSTGERIACVRLGSGTTTAFVPAADLITER